MLYLVTNRKIINGNYYEIIDRALASGVDRLILREKDLDYEDYLDLGKKVKKITDFYSVPLILNGNLEVVKELKAYSYHSSYFEILEKGKTYETQGVSIHSLEEAIKAEKLGADYLLAGHIFETQCKAGLKGIGLKFLKEIRKKVDIPVIAIGGITPENIGKIKSTGVNKVAVMSYIMSSKNQERDTKALKSALSSNRRNIDV